MSHTSIIRRLVPSLLAAIAMAAPALALEVATPTAPANLTLSPYRFAGYIEGDFSVSFGSTKIERGSAVVVGHPKVALSAAHVVFDDSFRLRASASDITYPWAATVTWGGVTPPTSPQRDLEIVHSENYANLKLYSDLARQEYLLEEAGGRNANASATIQERYKIVSNQNAAVDIVGLFSTSGQLTSAGDFPSTASRDEMLSPDTRKLLLGFPAYLNGVETPPELYSMHQIGPAPRPFTFDPKVSKDAIVPSPNVSIWGGNSGGPWFVATPSGEWRVGAIVGRGTGRSAPLSAKNSQAILTASIKRAGGIIPRDDAGDVTITDLAPASSIGTVIGEIIGDVDTFKIKIVSEGDYTISLTSGVEILAFLSKVPTQIIARGENTSLSGFSMKAHLTPGTYRVSVRGAVPSTLGNYSISCSGFNPAAAGIPNLALDVRPTTGSGKPKRIVADNLSAGASIRTDVVAFETHSAGSPPPVRTFRITNTGTASLSLPGGSPVTVSGTSASSFVVVTQPPGVILPGATGDFTVRFTARYNSGHGAALKLVSSDPNKPEIVVPVIGKGKGLLGADDHANNTVSAVTGGNTVTDATTNPSGFIDYAGDSDFYRLIVPARAVYRIYTTGPTDTIGTLYQLNGSKAKKVDSAKFGSQDGNFELQTVLDPGTYYIEVRGELKKSTTGEYQLHVSNVPVGGLLVVEGARSGLITDGDLEPSLQDGSDFGAVNVGRRANHTFKLVNYGTEMLLLTGNSVVTLSGSSAFTVAKQPPSTQLDPGKSTYFILSFAPTGSVATTATVDIGAFNGGLAGRSFRFAVKGGAGQLPLDATITNISSNPTSGTAGSQIQLTFTVESNQAANVLLGASLRAVDGTPYPIGVGFPKSIGTGTGDYTITGNVAANTPDGSYTIRGALWQDNNSNGIIDTGDTVIGSPVNFGSYTVGSSTLPPEFVQIPGGAYSIGDNLDGLSDAPVHTVTVSTFFLQNKETTIDEWNTVRTWALANGYSFTNAGQGKATGHPVHTVNWYDVVKWCNARSEMENLVPCYYTDVAQTVRYRTGAVNITNAMVKWSANGYRLPTEAEWEIAARGGLSGKRFPWGDTITHTLANYRSDSTFAYDASLTPSYHPMYNDGVIPYTSPAGAFAANAYGLHDMTGNVWEWCWDWYGYSYYNSPSASNPQGPTSGFGRIARGGSFGSNGDARCAARTEIGQTLGYSGVGFRPARSNIAPDGFAAIPGGTYSMGDSFTEGESDERPVHSVTVSTFYLQSKGTTKAEWDAVYTWAVAHNYSFSNAGLGKAATHPVHTVSWYDVVKWCNARSTMEGLTECYYTDAAQTVVYQTGNVDITNAMVKWGANGYRLPTEAEREIAARGGLSGKRFPWGDTISRTLANYPGNTGYSYDAGPNGFNPTYTDGTNPYTSPVGSFAPNGGLYDMAGNVWEWCWDWYDSSYYSNSPGTNPQGPVLPGSARVIRGGSFDFNAYYARCAYRADFGPASTNLNVGFRPARSNQ